MVLIKFKLKQTTLFLVYYHLNKIALQSWDAYFRNNSYSAPPSLAPPTKHHVPASQYLGSSVPAAMPGGGAIGARIDDKLIDDHLAVQAIIRSYQVSWNVYHACVDSGMSVQTVVLIFYSISYYYYSFIIYLHELKYFLTFFLFSPQFRSF